MIPYPIRALISKALIHYFEAEYILQSYFRLPHFRANPCLPEDADPIKFDLTLPLTTNTALTLLLRLSYLLLVLLLVLRFP